MSTSSILYILTAGPFHRKDTGTWGDPSYSMVADIADPSMDEMGYMDE
jgi:hypothetical protein